MGNPLMHDTSHEVVLKITIRTVHILLPYPYKLHTKFNNSAEIAFLYKYSSGKYAFDELGSV